MGSTLVELHPKKPKAGHTNLQIELSMRTRLLICFMNNQGMGKSPCFCNVYVMVAMGEMPFRVQAIIFSATLPIVFIAMSIATTFGFN